MAFHEALHLLRTCFAVPKVQYLLRSTPAFAAVAVADLSVAIREALSAVTNIQLDDISWLQASLPVRWGGAGVSDVGTLSASAFLSSHFSTALLVKDLLPAGLLAGPNRLAEAALASWSQAGGVNPPADGEAFSQRSWDDPICSTSFDHLLQRADQTSIEPDFWLWRPQTQAPGSRCCHAEPGPLPKH